VTPAFTRTFDLPGDFTAFNTAVSFLRARQFSVGPMQGPDPVGILFGTQIVVAKWRNLSQSQRAELHGVITGESKRSGPVTVEIYAHAPAAALRAVRVSKAA
jgi:hypothetical protein